MFRRPSEIRELVETVRPRSVVVEAEGDLPESFDLFFDAEEADLPGPRFETDGELRETPSGFESTGAVVVERRRPEEVHEVSLVEDGGFAVEGSHLVPVDSRLAAFVESTDAVRNTLSWLLSVVSTAVGTEVEAKVETHEVERRGFEGKTVVDVEYIASLEGLGGVSRTEGGRALGVNEATVRVSRGEETTVYWEIDLRNHQRLFADALADRGYAKADKLREARRRSEFTEELDWRSENGRRGFSAEVVYGTENAPRYLDELRRRGLETPAHTSFGFELDTRGKTKSGSVEFETDGDVTAGPRERLDAWTGFVPLPVAPLVSYIS